MSDLGSSAGLFFAALLAATLIPAQSEAVLVALLLAGSQPAWLLVLVATLGNVLGSTINWALGRGLASVGEHRLSEKRRRTLERAEVWYRRYGRWSLLLSWVPIIGDPITIVAGMLREPAPTFLLLVTLVKAGRYLVLALLTLAFSG